MSTASKMVAELLYGARAAPHETRMVSLVTRTGSAMRTLEPELIPVDRILQRWAVAIGHGMPSPEWDDRRLSLPPPLDDELAIIVDREVLHSPPKTKRIIFAWYKTPVPVEVMAARLSMSRHAVYLAWRLSLNYMRWRLEGTRNKGLAKILGAEVPSST